MKKLFCLTFYDLPDGDYRDGFHIGLFATYEEAATVAARYHKEVAGFKDYYCEAEITEVPVIGSCDFDNKP